MLPRLTQPTPQIPMSRIMLALFCALVAPALAQSPAPVPSAAAKEGIQLHVARTGTEVMLTWEIPTEIEVKRFEIYRNAQSDTKGRARAAAVRTTPAVFLDTVADANATYWYWLKITLANEQVINIGPVSTPDAKVWTP